MKMLAVIATMLAVVGASAAEGPFPEEMPDDFSFTYQVKLGDLPIDLGAGQYIKTFTASASGAATLVTKGGKELEFTLKPRSVKKLYRVVQALEWEAGQAATMPLKPGISGTTARVMVNGVERSWVWVDTPGDDKVVVVNKAVLEVLDENRPGWRDGT